MYNFYIKKIAEYWDVQLKCRIQAFEWESVSDRFQVLDINTVWKSKIFMNVLRVRTKRQPFGERSKVWKLQVFFQIPLSVNPDYSCS